MFNQNVLSLKKCNLNLADKLIGLSFDKARETIDIAKSESDDAIFIKNNIPLESTVNPIEEAFYEVQSSIKSSMGAFDFIIIFGLGVGYMLDYIFEKYNSKNIIPIIITIDLFLFSLKSFTLNSFWLNLT